MPSCLPPWFWGLSWGALEYRATQLLPRQGLLAGFHHQVAGKLWRGWCPHMSWYLVTAQFMPQQMRWVGVVHWAAAKLPTVWMCPYAAPLHLCLYSINKLSPHFYKNGCVCVYSFQHLTLCPSLNPVIWKIWFKISMGYPWTSNTLSC